jgi:hypothetical protein
MIVIPEDSLSYGFVISGMGAHTSRTIMLADLQKLLISVPASAQLEEYRSAVIEQNVLLKSTGVTRQETFRRLRALYGLNPNILLFRALRDLWDLKPEAQPILALLCAIARDPFLRASTDVVMSTPVGEEVTAGEISKAVDEKFNGRYNPIVAGIGRRTASSWQQSGHLQGKFKKIRSIPQFSPTSTAYGLFLGYLCGGRGDGLFDTFWSHLLCAPLHVLHDLAITAAKQGLLEYKHSGNVTEISFGYLMRENF